MQPVNSFWLSLLSSIIQGLILFFSGYKVAQWRLKKEIRLKHFEQIKEGVIQPLLRIIGTDLRDLLNKANSNVEEGWKEIKDNDKGIIGTEYFLKENDRLRDFLDNNSQIVGEIDKNLLGDLKTHFPDITNDFEQFRLALNHYSKNCLNFVINLQAKVDENAKEVGFTQDDISRMYYTRSKQTFVKTSAISVWIFKNLLEMNTRKLKVQGSQENSDLVEDSGDIFARGNVIQMNKLYSLSYDFSKRKFEEVFSLDQKIIELRKMKDKLLSNFQDLKSLNKLQGKCKYTEV